MSVMEQAVNTAARIESLWSRFDQPILFSEEFANLLTEPTRLVTEETLKGQTSTSKVLTISKVL